MSNENERRADAPGKLADVEDRGANVRITALKTCRAGSKVKVQFVWPLMRLRDGSVADY